MSLRWSGFSLIKKEMTFNYNEKEMTLVSIIGKLDDKVITVKQAGEALGCTKRTIYRKLSKYRTKWAKWLIHWLRWRRSNNRSDKREKYRKYALKKKYQWFWPTMLAESLEEELGRWKVCRESLRWKMIEWWIRSVKKRKWKVVRQKRVRRSKEWMMIQFDGSYHDWLESWEEYCLLLGVDDATGKLMKWSFSRGETLEEMIKFWRDYFEEYGKPKSLYVDRHATYKVNHEQDQFDEEMLTRFQKAMRKLNVTIIYAKEAQGKWRVERAFRTLQDRLIKKMRLEWIRNIKEAQKYLEEIYIAYHNKKFAINPIEQGNDHQLFTKQEKIRYERFFAKEKTRKVKKDGTIQYQNKKYQLPKWTRLYKWDTVQILENYKWLIEVWSGKDKIKVSKI